MQLYVILAHYLVNVLLVPPSRPRLKPKYQQKIAPTNYTDVLAISFGFLIYQMIKCMSLLVTKNFVVLKNTGRRLEELPIAPSQQG